MSPTSTAAAATWDRIREGHEVLSDHDLLVLDKPAGWSVIGERHDTDIVRVARDAGETLFPAHRIDKVTSGLVLFARRLAVHGDLTRQFADRSAAKTYLAVATGTDLPESGTIELPLSVGRKNRVRVAAPREAITRTGNDWTVADEDLLAGDRYPSTTTFTRLWTGEDRTLLAVTPTTGRRHQIRVHLAWIGHALVGDPLFERSPVTRTGLHAWRLGFTGPDGTHHALEAPPGDDFRGLVPGADLAT